MEPANAPRRRFTLALTLLALAAATAIHFAPALFLGRTLLALDERIFPPFVAALPRGVDGAPQAGALDHPQNFVTTDLQGWILAHTRSAVARMREGAVPRWDPTELLGRPLHADGSFPTFYPLDWIHLLTDEVTAYAWSVALHVLLAAVGMLLLLRRFELGPFAAAIGALAFAFSGWMLVHLHIPHFVRTAAWLPWCIAASWSLARRPEPGRALGLAGALGAMALAAYPVVLGTSLFALLLTLPGFLARSPARGRAVGWHVAAVAAGLALGAVQFLPMQELRAASLRDRNLTAEVADAKSLRPAHLIGLVAPDLAGNPVALRTAGIDRVEDFPVARELFASEVQDNYVENTVYPGIATLLLAFVAIAAWPRRGATWTFLLLVVAGGFIAAPTPLQWLFRDYLVPGLGSGSPKRILLLVAFGVAGLAALGAEQLLRAGRGTRALLVGAAIGLAGLCVVADLVIETQLAIWAGPEATEARIESSRRLVRLACGTPAALALLVAALAPWLRERSRALAAGGLALVLAGDLFLFGWRFNPFQPPEARGTATPVIDFLGSPEHAGRTLRVPARELLPASIVSAFGVESVDGVQALIIREVGELLDALQPGVIDAANPNQVGSFAADPELLQKPLVDLLARWFVTNVDLTPWVNAPPSYRNDAEGLGLFENPGWLPEAFFADRILVEPDRRRRLAALVASDFAPSRVAVVEDPVAVARLPASLFVAAASAPAESAPAARVDCSRADPETFRLQVDSPAPGIVVVNETWFPGWQVVGAGLAEVPLRVDHCFLGVAVPAGTSAFELRYAPRSLRIGAAISGAAALLMVVAGISAALQRRRLRLP